MSLDNATVAHIAQLARIAMPAEDLPKIGGELNQIIGWVEQLDEVDTAGVAPMTGVAGVDLPRRRDEVDDGGYPERIVANAPEPEDSYFTVPKVIE
jgi:aspartyl-tRNA(Asn)/glutamyl-tRNA(Gln) amidotransferase subunit C